MASEKVDTTQGEMLETIEFGEERNELLDTLVFSVSCSIGNLEDILVEGCQEKFAKISHLPKAGSKTGQIEHIPLSI